MNSIYLKFIFLLTLFSEPLLTQNEGNIWYFGRYAGVEFTTGSPVALTDGNMNTSEGCATICDGEGSLLFYTDGITVWNKNHNSMSNGNNLLGDPSSTQSGIIVPAPNSDSLYYVFTVDRIGGPDGLCYSVVDMSLNGGLGEVTTKNFQLMAPITEKVTAVLHSNYSDYWIITHDLNSDGYYAFLLTDTGMQTVPVISNIGLTHTDEIGYLKSSHSGDQLICAITYMQTVEVIDFDRTTGVLSNLLSLSGLEYPYGIETSADDSRLYIASRKPSGGQNIKGELVQYNLALTNNADIINSKEYVYQSSNLSEFGALQIGPDEKIYVSIFNQTYLGVINDPGNNTSNCNFEYNGIDLNGKICRQGLPNMLPSFFKQPEITSTAYCVGDSTTFELNNTNFIDSVRWNFGDTISGSLNYSYELSSKHLFSDTGIFNIALLYYKDAVSDTLYEKIYIYPQPDFELGKDTSICEGASYTLQVTLDSVSYLWQDYSTLSFFVTNQTGEYSVLITDENSCKSSDTINITVNKLPVINLGADTFICQDSNIILNAYLENAVYAWHDGSVDSVFAVDTSGLYWVKVIDSNQCVNTDTLIVEYKTSPVIDLGKDTALCSPEIVFLDAQNSGSTYLWQDGSMGYSYVVDETGVYWVEITNICATVMDTIVVNINYADDVNLGNDTTLCEGDSLILKIDSLHYDVSWFNGDTTVDYTVTDAGNYWANITNTYGCTSSDSVTINYISKPNSELAGDTKICRGDTATIAIFAQDANIEWSNGVSDSINYISDDGNYWVKSSNKCGANIDSFIVEYYTSPDIYLGSDTVLCESEKILLNAYKSEFKTYLWQDGDTNSAYLANYFGNYWVQVTDTNNCTSKDTIALLQDVSNELDLGKDTTLCMDQILELEVEDIYNSYEWNDYHSSNVLTIEEEGTYRLTTTSDYCTYKDTIIIDYTICNLKIPTVITINDDGINDVWEITGDGDWLPRVEIFNRWGTKVYQAANYTNDWSGDHVTDGTYYYFVEYPKFQIKECGFVEVIKQR